MKSNLKARFTVSFYEETHNDMVLLEALNRMCQPRLRGNKVKELAFEALKQLQPEMVKEIERELNKNNSGDNEVAMTKQTTKRKRALPGMNVIALSEE